MNKKDLLKTVKNLENKIPILEDRLTALEQENNTLRNGLEAVLRGDMQSLAYNLYPNDFEGVKAKY